MMKKEKNYEEQDNFLRYIPVIKHKDYKIKDDIVYLIFYHNKLAERFLRKINKKRPAISDIKFDKIGSNVWMNIDGRKNVYDLGKCLLEMPILKKEYENTTEKDYINGCHPIYQRLIMFLRYVSKKGWISFILSDDIIKEKH
ncbi:PqqD family protein [Clostridium senegalense]|uniref:PqqD family protein n=1 Tax=Clostridium senegalense TaxID=1465809 RepID=UPI001FD627FA|nr:PqqD family protein [Clostridium senegalense]